MGAVPRRWRLCWRVFLEGHARDIHPLPRPLLCDYARGGHIADVVPHKGPVRYIGQWPRGRVTARPPLETKCTLSECTATLHRMIGRRIFYGRNSSKDGVGICGGHGDQPNLGGEGGTVSRNGDGHMDQAAGGAASWREKLARTRANRCHVEGESPSSYEIGTS